MRVYSKSQGKVIEIPDTQGSGLSPTTGMATAGTVNTISGNSGGMDLQKILGLMELSKGNATGAWNILKPTTGNKPAGATFKDISNALSGLESIKYVREKVTKDPFLLLKTKLPPVLASLSGAGSFQQRMKEITDVYTRIRTGAALNVDEQKFYDSMLPNIGDIKNPQEAEMKLKLFENLFTRIAGSQPTADTTGSEDEWAIEEY